QQAIPLLVCAEKSRRVVSFPAAEANDSEWNRAVHRHRFPFLRSEVVLVLAALLRYLLDGPAPCLSSLVGVVLMAGQNFLPRLIPRGHLHDAGRSARRGRCWRGRWSRCLRRGRRGRSGRGLAVAVLGLPLGVEHPHHVRGGGFNRRTIPPVGKIPALTHLALVLFVLAHKFDAIGVRR